MKVVRQARLTPIVFAIGVALVLGACGLPALGVSKGLKPSEISATFASDPDEVQHANATMLANASSPTSISPDTAKGTAMTMPAPIVVPESTVTPAPKQEVPVAAASVTPTLASRPLVPTVAQVPTTPPTQSQPAQPTRTSLNVPAEGRVLYNRPLSGWRSETSFTGSGWTQATSDSLNIGVWGVGTQRTAGAYTSEDDFSDISATVSVRLLTPGVDAKACLSVRHSADLGDYSFCVTEDGRTVVSYDYSDGQGVWRNQVLLPEGPLILKSVQEWNELKVIARGPWMWLLVNGSEIAIVQHDARSTGSVALYVVNWDDDDAIFDFQGLVVRDVS